MWVISIVRQVTYYEYQSQNIATTKIVDEHQDYG